MKKIFKKFRKKTKPIRYIFEYIGVMIIYYPVRMMPLKMVFAFADFIGFFLYLFPPFRKIVQANLKVAFPEKENREIRKLARKNATNLILFTLEFFWFINRHDKLKEIMYFSDDLKNLIADCNKKKIGLIWVTPHLGNWELARIGISNNNTPMAVVARTMNNPYIDKLINSGRKADGSSVITAKGAIKGMITSLKKGEIIATLIDQNTRARDGGIFVDFFGLPVCSSRAPALFGRKFKSVLAICGAVRTGYSYEMILSELSRPASDYSSDEELINDLLKLTEEYIRKYPEQYLWMYERWKHIPENLDEETKKRYPYYAKEVTPRFYSEQAKKNAKF